jgi:hypothetical protein
VAIGHGFNMDDGEPDSFQTWIRHDACGGILRQAWHGPDLKGNPLEKTTVMGVAFCENSWHVTYLGGMAIRVAITISPNIDSLRPEIAATKTGARTGQEGGMVMKLCLLLTSGRLLALPAAGTSFSCQAASPQVGTRVGEPGASATVHDCSMSQSPCDRQRIPPSASISEIGSRSRVWVESTAQGKWYTYLKPPRNKQRPYTHLPPLGPRKFFLGPRVGQGRASGALLRKCGNHGNGPDLAWPS